MDDYRKELNRINRYIKKKEKEGFTWSTNYKQSLRKKSVNKLKSITPEILISKATVFDKETGRTIKASVALSKKDRIPDFVKEENKVTNKERRRIRAYFKANEARGFRWSEEYKKKILSERYDILKNIHAKELLEEATALSPISGDIVSGTQARHEFNQLRGKKAWATRQRKKAEQTPDISTEAYDRIMEMIDEQPLKTASIILRDFLDKQIVEYGFENVCRGLASAQEEAIDLVRVALEDSKGGRLRSSISKLSQIIKGAMLTEEEAKDIGEAMDADESINDGFVDVDEEDIPEQFRD